MSLLRRIEERMLNSKLNANFNREVSKSREITEEDKRNFTQVHESFKAYKKKDSNWKQHFE